MLNIRGFFYTCLLTSLFFLPGNAQAVFLNPYSCSVSATPLNFGIYWGTTPLSSTATVTVACSPPSTTQVQLDKGQNVAIGFASRKMASGVNTINYNLYTNATHTKIWGDGTNGSFSLTGGNLTIYGLMPAGQVITPGAYNDSVVITIIW